MHRNHQQNSLELTSTSHWPALNVIIGEIGIVIDPSLEEFRCAKVNESG